MLNYRATLTRLDDFSNFEKKAHLLKPVFSLDGELAILRGLGDPHAKYPCVHVAGTVGKGTVCQILDGALRSAGLRTGLYTSPHIKDIRERIRVNGKMITQKEFVSAYEAVVGRGRARPDEHTYFEALTAMAFLHFARHKVDIAVVETGLGGRLDSTNVCPPFLSVITRIGHDHTAVLGNTLAKIAGEKAGIIKPGAPVVALRQHHSVNRVIERTARRKKSVAFWADRKNIPTAIMDAMPEGYQNNKFFIENLSIACAAVEALDGKGTRVAEKHLRKSVSTLNMPARMQWSTLHKSRGRVRMLVDAAHNPPAARALRHEIERTAGDAPVTLVLAMMRDKDAAGFCRELAPAADAVFCADLPMPRAWSAGELATRAARHCRNTSTAPNVHAAMDAAFKHARPGHILCVTGSFYAVEFAEEWMKQRRK